MLNVFAAVRRPVVVFLALAAALAPLTVASAHIVIWPPHSAPGVFEHYIVYVPAEKPGTPSVELRLFIPPGVVVDGTAEMPGWRVSAEKTAGRITVLSWSGGRVPPDRYAAFGFAARNPTGVRAITWQAVQLYGDGTAVVWAGAAGTARPAAVTLLDAVPADPRALASAPSNLSTLASAPSNLSTLTLVALVVGAVGLVCGLSSLGVLLVVLRHRLLS